MQVNAGSSPSHRQLLVHSHVTNSRNEKSSRYVEQSLYALWRHLITARHGLNVWLKGVNIWVPQDQLTPHMSHSQKNELVTRLTMIRYEASTGITTHAQRFIPETDLDQVAHYLGQHWRAAGDPNDTLSFNQEPGWAIA